MILRPETLPSGQWPHLSALVAHLSENGSRIPAHRVLAFLHGSSVSVEEYQRFTSALPVWLAFHGRDLATELNMAYEALIGVATATTNRPSQADAGW